MSEDETLKILEQLTERRAVYLFPEEHRALERTIFMLRERRGAWAPRQDICPLCHGYVSAYGDGHSPICQYARKSLNSWTQEMAAHARDGRVAHQLP